MQHEMPPVGSPASWLRYARSDLALATQPVKEGILPEVYCFHAQQAAEKALKAVLVAKGASFPYTHDLARLIGLLDSSGVCFPEQLRGAAGLTVYAVTARYPGPADDIDAEEFREALHIASQVVAWADDFLEDV